MNMWYKAALGLFSVVLVADIIRMDLCQISINILFILMLLQCHRIDKLEEK